MLVGALLVMGIATVLIGFLPTYEQVGVLAPILLVIIRIIQGLAFGAEWGGAIMMTFEHAPWKKRGRYTAIPQAGVPLGLLLANLVFLSPPPSQNDWSWRLPFLASSVLIVAGLIVRMKLEESPEFEHTKAKGAIVKNPLPPSSRTTGGRSCASSPCGSWRPARTTSPSRTCSPTSRRTTPTTAPSASPAS